MTFQLSANTAAGGSPARSAAELADLRARVDALNTRYRHHGAVSVLEGALRDPEAGNIALVSSFGAESVALLHLVAMKRTTAIGPRRLRFQQNSIETKHAQRRPQIQMILMMT